MKQFFGFILILFLSCSLGAVTRLCPERALPESAYKSAFGCCTSLWYELRKNQEGITKDKFIDGLIVLDGIVTSLADHRGAYSLDDIEHLAGSLNKMHMDYANTAVDVMATTAKESDDSYDTMKAAHYFFKRIKRKIESLLPQ